MKKHILNLMELLECASELHHYLNGRIEFDKEGWPIFKREYFLDKWPDQIVTYQQRLSKIVIDPSKTLICTYSYDSRIYPRVANVLAEINEYRKYMGVIGADITITCDMDIEMQDAIMMVNQLYMATLAVNGIKIVLNTRTGLPVTNRNFHNIPKNIMCASGFFSCANCKTEQEAFLYIDKILGLLPEKLVIYGKKDNRIEKHLNVLGIDYKRLEDFHKLRKRRVA